MRTHSLHLPGQTCSFSVAITVMVDPDLSSCDTFCTNNQPYNQRKMLSLEIYDVFYRFRYLKFCFICSSHVFGVHILLDIDISCSSPMDISAPVCAPDKDSCLFILLSF